MSALKYLALGDSYTIGESVTKDERWPNRLAAILLAHSIDLGAPTIIATTGWRTDNLENAIKIANLSNDFDLVSLLIGVNNQYQGKPFEQYVSEFERLIRMCLQLVRGGSKRAFAVSIPDYGCTPFGLKNKDKISREIDRYNEVAKGICDRYQIQYVDVTGISREALHDRELIAVDGLHPSGKMYTLWAKKIAAEVNLV